VLAPGAIELLPRNVQAKVAPVFTQACLMGCVLGFVERPHGDRKPPRLRQQFIRSPLQPVVLFGDCFNVHGHRPPLDAGESLR
jgi:hypothetical protein